MRASGLELARQAGAASFKINELESRVPPESASSTRTLEERNYPGLGLRTP
jgi:hypothetical protein